MDKVRSKSHSLGDWDNVFFLGGGYIFDHNGINGDILDGLTR